MASLRGSMRLILLASFGVNRTASVFPGEMLCSSNVFPMSGWNNAELTMFTFMDNNCPTHKEDMNKT